MNKSKFQTKLTLKNRLFIANGRIKLPTKENYHFKLEHQLKQYPEQTVQKNRLQFYYSCTQKFMLHLVVNRNYCYSPKFVILVSKRKIQCLENRRMGIKSLPRDYTLSRWQNLKQYSLVLHPYEGWMHHIMNKEETEECSR